MSKSPSIRLFVEKDLSEGTLIALDKNDAHYLKNVMRLKEGNAIKVFNGKDGEWDAALAGEGGKSSSLRVSCQIRKQTPEPDLWLAFAPIKKARIDFVAQKATELGVSRLIPVRTDRTIVTRIKKERLWANAKEAAEQCERMNIPYIEDMVALKTLLKGWLGDRQLLFCDESKKGKLISETLLEFDQKPARKPWGILIGPEGGFTDQERDMILNHPAVVHVALGPRVLRADTAMLSALTLWQAMLGDW